MPCVFTIVLQVIISNLSVMKSVRIALLCLAALSAFSAGPVQAKKQKRPTQLYLSPDTVVYKITNQMPLFRGRPFNSALVEWIGSQLRYPEDMAKRKVQGKVWASFIVERDRSISNIEIISAPDKSLGMEVLRVLRSMPLAWTPGIDSTGRAVRVLVAVPVIFRLD